jgi:hypothetical protein
VKAEQQIFYWFSGIFQIVTSMNIRLPVRYPKLGVISAGKEALYGLLFYLYLLSPLIFMVFADSSFQRAY